MKKKAPHYGGAGYMSAFRHLHSIKKYPPFGKALAERLKFNNHPDYVFVCVGMDAWERARRHNGLPDRAALVLTDAQPERFRWPVSGCLVIVEWDDGPAEKVLNVLLGCLIRAGCSRLVSWYIGRREAESHYFNLETGRWVDGFCHI